MTQNKIWLITAILSILFSQPQLFAVSRKVSIPERIGVKRGICVIAGDTGCETALELAEQSELLIYVQLADEDVQAAREAADAAGVYGSRIWVEGGNFSRLHLADNLADVVIAQGQSVSQLDKSELLRVLRPGGKAFLGKLVFAKDFPSGIDDWSHPYHGPDNNPQSTDHVARAPYLTQFFAEPRYGSLPQVAVASSGRVFKAFGHVAFKKREEPFLNTLVAFNGYNGTILWKRKLTEGVMVHRNTLIATPEIVYLGDDKSCKLIDAVTGELKDEIIPPVETAGGTFWKWMGLEDGILYAVIGEQEKKDQTKRWVRKKHGWLWGSISKGYNQSRNPWGYGRNVLAIDLKTKKILWHHKEYDAIDCRGVCMKNDRIFITRLGSFLVCLDAKSGKELWRKTPVNAAEIFDASGLGNDLNRQGASENWRTTSYIKCSDKAVYFAGPQIGKLLAVSAETGNILWEHPYSNFQLVLREDGLYGLSGNWPERVSKKFDPLTGEILADLAISRRSCTRPVGSIDGIFTRAGSGTVRYTLNGTNRQWISPMRAQCHDGVTIADGLLYFWPSVCDCALSILGVTSLGPAGDFDFTPTAKEADRLEEAGKNLSKIAKLDETEADWPSFRGNNKCDVTTKAILADKCELLWQYDPQRKFSDSFSPPTAPVAVGGLAFLSGPDGIVRCLYGETGKLKWKAYTGGTVRIPPAIWRGRGFVGSGDGWVYCFEAKTGRLLWRFRGAPVERKIPVYDSLMSTWPAASGVLVEDGVAYAAAGIVNYDGTYLYALDAETGKIKWQNNTSGHLDAVNHTGVSVHGHLLLNNDKLYMPGGTSISPAVYDIKTGRCLNDPKLLERVFSPDQRIYKTISPRGWELYVLGKQVLARGKPFYAHPKWPVYDHSVRQKMLVATTGDKRVVWANTEKILCFINSGNEQYPKLYAAWGKTDIPGLEPLWEYDCKTSTAFAVCSNAVVVAKEKEVVALTLEEGKVLWSQPIPLPTVAWGLAVDRYGRVIVVLEDGRVLCFG